MSLKVLHIVPRYSVGGAEQLAFQFVTGLDKNKYDLYIACTVESGELVDRYNISADHNFVGSRTQDKGRLAVAKRFWTWVKDLRPDIIHTHLFGADLFGYFIRKHANWPVKWVSTQHNVEFKTSALRRMIWRRILPTADKVIAVSESVFDYDKEYFKLSAPKLQCIPNGINLTEWTAVPPVINQNEIITFATIGRLEVQKGHIFLLQALAGLPRNTWRLKIFGDGSERDSLILQAEKLGIANSVEWCGVSKSLQTELEAVDVVVQPSLWEGMSLVVMEAMAAGRAVVASEAAGQGLISDRVNGRLVSVGQVEGLQAALTELINSPILIPKWGEKARQVAQENFSLTLTLQKISELYDQIV